MEVIKSNLKYVKYLYVLTSVKNSLDLLKEENEI